MQNYLAEVIVAMVCRCACVFLLAMALLYGTSAFGSRLDYEIYLLDAEGTRTLLAKGVKDYQLGDVQVRSDPHGQYSQKWVVVWEDYSVGVSVHPADGLTGFGLWIERPTNSFSWDWFDLEDGDVFTKRQGEGRVRIQTKEAGGVEEIIAVEFLSDVTLRGQFSHVAFMPLPEKDTHHIVIKQGSVLRVAADD